MTESRRLALGDASAIEALRALAEIRDARLYRDSHTTFEGYCRERWGMSRQRASQFIEAEQTVRRLSTNVDNAPRSEFQVRPLAALPPEQQPAPTRRTRRTAATTNA